MIAVHLENGRVEVRTTPKPRRPKGFASIRLLLGGICNTDLELKRGYYGFIGTPGHEFVGEVIDADTQALIGRRVVGEINLACHACDWCRRGLERHCPRRTVLGIVKHPGAFREVLTLPERNLHVLPKNLPTEHAVFVEPLAAACEILDQITIPPGSRVAVLGKGKLGLLIAQVLQISGARVDQFDRHSEKPHAEYDWVVDATGSAEGLRQAILMCRPRGTVVMKSTVHGSIAIDTAAVIVNEITLVGSRCGRFEPAIKLLSQGKIQVAGMISEEMALSDAAAAFERAAQKGVLKVLLRA